MKRRILLIALPTLILVLLLIVFLLKISSRPATKPRLVFPTPTPFSQEELERRRRSGAPGPNPTEYFEYEENVRKTDPDIYLANRLPYSTSTFSMTKFTNWKTGATYFIVSLRGSDSIKSREDAISWMRSLRLTDSQIQSLSISYQPEAVVKLKEEKLPYYGTSFSIGYDKSFDATKVVIYLRAGEAGEQEFDAFLKENGITDRSQINNLTTLYH